MLGRSRRLPRRRCRAGRARLRAANGRLAAGAGAVAQHAAAADLVLGVQPLRGSGGLPQGSILPQRSRQRPPFGVGGRVRAGVHRCRVGVPAGRGLPARRRAPRHSAAPCALAARREEAARLRRWLRIAARRAFAGAAAAGGSLRRLRARGTRTDLGYRAGDCPGCRRGPALCAHLAAGACLATPRGAALRRAGRALHDAPAAPPHAVLRAAHGRRPDGSRRLARFRCRGGDSALGGHRRGTRYWRRVSRPHVRLRSAARHRGGGPRPVQRGDHAHGSPRCAWTKTAA